jgi:diacylglycerol kinase (ATP)
MRIELIINCSDAGDLEALRLAVADLRGDGHVVRGWRTFEVDDAECLAAEAVARKPDLILAAGGDGTVNQVVNGMVGAEGGASSSEDLPALGIVPLGTANDLANWLEIPEGIADAVRSVTSGSIVEADVIAVNERFFINVSTGGFGAEASGEAAALTKKALGSFAYVATGVRKFAGLQPSSARFISGGEVIFEGDFLLFAVGNGARTGGGNWLTPAADLYDGLLDLCIVRSMSHTEFLRALPDLRAGTHRAHPGVIYRQLPEVTIEVPGEEISVNADGEPIDAERFHYRVLPRAIRLVRPG